MDQTAAVNRLTQIARSVAAERDVQENLERQKREGLQNLARPDFVWHFLVESFATMGRSSGYDGLIANQENYQQVTYPALAALTREARNDRVPKVCWAAKIRMPDIKAGYILACFDQVKELGGPEEAKAKLLAEKGREAKIRFWRRFKGIGPKYSRNIMMCAYHEEFRSSIAIDSRINAISKALGLSFTSYACHESFYLEVAGQAGLNGWELDRLLYNFRHRVESQLGIKGGEAGPAGYCKNTC